MNIVSKLTELSTAPLMILLVGGGIFLTIKLGFFQLVHFPHILKMTLGSIFKKSNNEGEGTISPFQAASSALAATMGAANIVGVPVAIALGGPGAIFWMWVVAFLGMATKYSEVVLGMEYRSINEKGEYVGGPMYYIQKGLGWKWMSVAYVIISTVAIIASGSVQSNALSGIIAGSFNIPTIASGVIISILVAIVMLGGIKSIGKFAEKVVPSMALLYSILALIVIIVNIGQVPTVFALIFKHAFTPASAAGGFTGAAVSAAIRSGIARGLYSNEAGVGSAAMAHSSATNNHPAKQGFWGVFEVFIDTIVVCSMTAFVVLSTGVWQTIGANDAASMPAKAMGLIIGDSLAGTLISIIITFFAFTTILVIAFFAEKQIEYLFGYKASVIARYIYIVAVLVGSTVSLVLIWSLLDILFALTVIPNMVAVLLLSGKVKEITTDYFSREYKKESPIKS